MVGKGCRVLIGDLSRLERITSTGVGFIAYYASQMRSRGGQVLVVKPPEDVMDKLSSARIDSLIPFFGTLGEALEHGRAALAASPG
jgi:anti-anti-sigma factor